MANDSLMWKRIKRLQQKYRVVLKIAHKIPLLSGLIVPVAAQSDSRCDLQTAMHQYESGQFESAARLLTACAKAGNAKARLRLATLYHTGTGVEYDETEAAFWYRQAAEQGEPEAQFHLGLMYLEGVGVTESTDMALFWVGKAADNGFGDAISIRHYMLSTDEVLDC